MLYFFKTCVYTIRQLSVLQHDKSKVEDLDTDMEDHAADETRYACMSRPLTIKHVDPIIREEGKIYVDQATKQFKQLIKQSNDARL